MRQCRKSFLVSANMRQITHNCEADCWHRVRFRMEPVRSEITTANTYRSWFLLDFCATVWRTKSLGYLANNSDMSTRRPPLITSRSPLVTELTLYSLNRKTHVFPCRKKQYHTLSMNSTFVDFVKNTGIVILSFDHWNRLREEHICEGNDHLSRRPFMYNTSSSRRMRNAALKRHEREVECAVQERLVFLL